MADETSLATMDDAVFSEWLDEFMIPEIRPYNVMRPLFRYRGAESSSTFSFTLWDDPGAASTSAEGVIIPNTALTSSKVQVTAETVGIMATVTKELTRTSLFAMIPAVRGVLFRSVAEKAETDYTALLDDFTNRTGTSGSPYTWAQRAEAITALANRDALGQLVEVLHTQQVGHLTQDTTTSTAAMWGNDSISIGEFLAQNLGGFAFTANGVPTFQTSLVPTADAGVNRNGAMFVLGLALGMYEIWGPESQMDEDINLPGTEVVVTQRQGVGVVRNTWGQGLKTSASA